MAKGQAPGGEAYHHDQGRLERLALKKTQDEAAARAAKEKTAPAAKKRFAAQAAQREARLREIDGGENAAARSDPTPKNLKRRKG